MIESVQELMTDGIDTTVNGKEAAEIAPSLLVKPR
jgi:hypothetical protein